MRLDVIASQRVGAKRRPMTGSATQFIVRHKKGMDCFVALLLAMTVVSIASRPRRRLNSLENPRQNHRRTPMGTSISFKRPDGKDASG